MVVELLHGNDENAIPHVQPRRRSHSPQESMMNREFVIQTNYGNAVGGPTGSSFGTTGLRSGFATAVTLKVYICDCVGESPS